MKEECIICGIETGFAGKDDDSLYVCGKGPFCVSCYHDEVVMRLDVTTAENTRLAAEVKALRELLIKEWRGGGFIIYTCSIPWTKELYEKYGGHADYYWFPTIQEAESALDAALKTKGGA